MNEHLRSDPLRLDRTRFDLQWPQTTQAADGLPRRAWSGADIVAMVRAGIIDEDERFELIGGEMVPMSPKGACHELVTIALNRHLQRHALRSPGLQDFPVSLSALGLEPSFGEG